MQYKDHDDKCERKLGPPIEPELCEINASKNDTWESECGSPSESSNEGIAVDTSSDAWTPISGSFPGWACDTEGSLSDPNDAAEATDENPDEEEMLTDEEEMLYRGIFPVKATADFNWCSQTQFVSPGRPLYFNNHDTLYCPISAGEPEHGWVAGWTRAFTLEPVPGQFKLRKTRMDSRCIY